jgi:hypothetical protein
LAKAYAEYSRALKATQAALVDPERWRSDGVLAAVLLLGMFEVSTPPLATFLFPKGLADALDRTSPPNRSAVWLGGRMSRARSSLSRPAGGAS